MTLMKHGHRQKSWSWSGDTHIHIYIYSLYVYMIQISRNGCKQRKEVIRVGDGEWMMVAVLPPVVVATACSYGLGGGSMRCGPLWFINGRSILMNHPVSGINRQLPMVIIAGGGLWTNGSPIKSSQIFLIVCYDPCAIVCYSWSYPTRQTSGYTRYTK